MVAFGCRRNAPTEESRKIPVALTIIDTNQLPIAQTAQGAMTEVLNQQLAGAMNVVGTLRWLNAGERFTAHACDKHQLIYLMEGAACIQLENKEYGVQKGGGVYLGPHETATLSAPGGATAKLFHLVVKYIPR
jgi:quercetin dioxygenase-like cupin family protein